MSEVVGRAGFDVEHIRHGKEGNRGNRERSLAESMRELGDDVNLAYQASRNPNIRVDATAENEAFVNDGNGGFKRATSIKEVVDYGDERVKQVYRKISPKSFTVTRIVVTLPKSMCHPVQYQRSDGKWRTRWEANDRDEARRYFADALANLGDKVLWGGQAAIHGYDINWDETTPHMQVMADTFAGDPKHEDRLRVCASQMWGQHREVRDPEDGHQITKGDKLSAYQAGFREHMVAQGYPVSLEPDPVRRKRKLDKPDYVEVEEQRQAAARESGAAQMALMHAKRLERDAESRGFAQGLEEGQEYFDDAIMDMKVSEATLSVRVAELDEEIAAAKVRERAAAEAEAAHRAEVERLETVPPNVEVWLDRKKLGGKPVRETFERDTAPRRDARRSRIDAIVAQHTIPETEVDDAQLR